MSTRLEKAVRALVHTDWTNNDWVELRNALAEAEERRRRMPTLDEIRATLLNQTARDRAGCFKRGLEEDEYFEAWVNERALQIYGVLAMVGEPEQSEAVRELVRVADEAESWLSTDPDAVHLRARLRVAIAKVKGAGQ